jgi:hypothetical protein
MPYLAVAQDAKTPTAVRGILRIHEDVHVDRPRRRRPACGCCPWHVTARVLAHGGMGHSLPALQSAAMVGKRRQIAANRGKVTACASMKPIQTQKIQGKQSQIAPFILPTATRAARDLQRWESLSDTWASQSESGKA